MLEKIKGILLEFMDESYDRDKISKNTGLQEDLGFDLGFGSLDLMEIVLMVEEKFGVTIPDENCVGIKTVGDLYELARKSVLDKYIYDNEIKKKLGEEGEIFFAKLIEEYDKDKKYIEILELPECCSIDLEVPDGNYGKTLKISMHTKFNEITVGHEFKDHDHFSEEIDGELYMKKALDYARKIFNKQAYQR